MEPEVLLAAASLFHARLAMVGFVAAHLLYLYQIIFGCSWWKSTNSSLPLRRSILL